MTGDTQACPRCGGTEVERADILKRHVNPWVFYFGGWLVSLLWAGSRQEEVRCVQCGTAFQRTTRASRVAQVLLIALILLILLALWAELSGSQPGGGE